MDALPTSPFTFAMALEAGLTRRQLRRLLAVGRVRRVVAGVYAPSGMRDTIGARAQALRLVTPPDCVVVDRHAGWLLGAEMVLAPGEHLALRPLSLFRPAGRGRLRNTLSTSGERSLAGGDVTEVRGLRVTTPLRTALDLGRVRFPAEAISGMDALLRLGTFEPDALLRGVDRFKGHRWVTTLRVVAPLADGRAESPGESVLRLRCLENGLTDLVPQVEVTCSSGRRVRLDLADRERKVAVEYDGVEWHSSPDQRADDRARRADLVADGWMMEVFGAENLYGPLQDADRRLTALRLHLERRHPRSA